MCVCAFLGTQMIYTSFLFFSCVFIVYTTHMQFLSWTIFGPFNAVFISEFVALFTTGVLVLGAFVLLVYTTQKSDIDINVYKCAS